MLSEKKTGNRENLKTNNVINSWDDVAVSKNLQQVTGDLIVRETISIELVGEEWAEDVVDFLSEDNIIDINIIFVEFINIVEVE